MRAFATASALVVLSVGQAYAAAASTMELPGDKVFPESVTATSDGTIYVGSPAEGGVMRIPKGATKAEPWIKPGAFDSRSTFGVLADERSGILWVCSNDASALGASGPNEVKGSALKGFDLKTGEGKVSVALPGQRALCNDIAIGPDGAAYVTNSFSTTILRLPQGAKDFEAWVTNDLFEPPHGGAGLDGIAFAKDGTAYVDTFNKAEMFRIDAHGDRAINVTKLETSRPLVLADALRPIVGADGFLLVEGEGRLDRVTMSGDQAKIETLKDGLKGPTGVAQVGSVAWVSEGQLSYLFGKQGSPDLPFDLRGVQLPTP